MPALNNPLRIKLDDALITWSVKPTEQDATGCDGIYIASVALTRQYRFRMWIASILIGLAAMILGARVRFDD